MLTPTMHAASMSRSSTTTFLHVRRPVEESVYFHMRRHATREIVQVNFKTTTADAQTWAVFGSHWPSRGGGQFESEGYHAIAGETLGYFHQRVLEVHGAHTPLRPLLKPARSISLASRRERSRTNS